MKGRKMKGNIDKEVEKQNKITEATQHRVGETHRKTVRYEEKKVCGW